MEDKKVKYDMSSSYEFGKNKIDTVIWFGGSINDCDIFEKLNKIGVRIILIDRDRFCPGRSYADQFLNYDAYDSENIIKRISSIRFNANKTVCYGSFEHTLPSIAAVNEHFGLRGITQKSLIGCLDKGAAKKIWNESGTPTPPWIYVHNKHQSFDDIDLFKFPAILKINGTWSGRGIIPISNKENLKRHIENLDNNSAILEKKINGKTWRTRGFLSDNRYIKLGVVELKSIGNFGKTSLEVLDYNNTHFFNKLHKKAVKAAFDVGISDGFFLADMIYDEKTIYILEITPVFPNRRVRDLLLFSGLDLIYSYFGFSSFNNQYLKGENKLIYLSSSLCIENINNIKKNQKIVGFYRKKTTSTNEDFFNLYLPTGVKCINNDGSLRRIGHIVVGAETFQQGWELINYIIKTIIVDLDDGSKCELTIPK